MLQRVRLVIEERLARVIFDCEDKPVNTIDGAFFCQLEDAIKKVEANSDLEMVIFESAKEHVFIAGADIREIEKIADVLEAQRSGALGQGMFNRISALVPVTVALINGVTLGGGLELALACDFRIALDDPVVKLGLPETTLGIIPGFGGTVRLPRLIGFANSLSMIITGARKSAGDAYELGLVDFIAPFKGDLELLAIRLRELDFRKEIFERRRKIERWQRRMEEFTLVRRLIVKKTEEAVRKSSGNHYPALFKAIEVIAYGWNHSEEEALHKENREFARLALSQTCKNLIQLFYTDTALKNEDFGYSVKKERSFSRVALLGGGRMGSSIAITFLKKGWPVLIRDITEKALKNAVKYIEAYFEQKGIENPGQVATTLETRNLKDADIIIEAAVEDLDIKSPLFAELEKIVSDEAIIVSNTSSLPISQLAKSFNSPQRFAGLHYFNPAHRMKLVEIIPGRQTTKATVADLLMLVKKSGKVPLVVKDSPGFLINRLLMAYLGEAIHLYEEGVSVVRIDRIFQKFGMPMGPFRLLDEVGLDIAFHVSENLVEAFPGRFCVHAVLEEKIAKMGLLGRKGGKGFYVYKKKVTVNTQLVSGEDKPDISDEDILMRPLLALLNEAAFVLEEGVISSAPYLDMGLIQAIGFPPYIGGILRYADGEGVGNVYKKLLSYQKKINERFLPADLLKTMGAKRQSFYRHR